MTEISAEEHYKGGCIERDLHETKLQPDSWLLAPGPTNNEDLSYCRGLQNGAQWYGLKF